MPSGKPLMRTTVKYPRELQQALLDYCEAFGEKIDNIARYIHAQEAVIAIAGTEAERYSRRKATAENAVAVEEFVEVLHGEPPNPLDERSLEHYFAAQEQPGLAAAFGSNQSSGRVPPSVSQHERSRVERCCSVSA